MNLFKKIQLITLTGLFLASASWVDAQRAIMPEYFMSLTHKLPDSPVTNASAITRVGGVVTTYTHPDFSNSKLSIVQLPMSQRATNSGARALAASGFIQSGDVMIAFRPGWSKTNGYGKAQLGAGHAAALLVVPNSQGIPTAHSLENPLSWSTPLTHRPHYENNTWYHIVRPKGITQAQQTNLGKWGRAILRNAGRIGFYGNYGSPYYSRGNGNTPQSLIKKMAEAAKGRGNIETYCSEFVWAFLGLKDVDFDTYNRNTRIGPEKMIFNPIAAAYDNLPRGGLSKPGLMQSADLIARQLESSPGRAAFNDAERRNYIAGTVLKQETTNPSVLANYMSSGHRTAATNYQPKVQQFQAWYTGNRRAIPQLSGPEDTTYVPALNHGVIANYSPASFYIMSNTENSPFQYVGTLHYGNTFSR